MKISYITLPNALLDMKLTANELAVFFYLSSIYAGGKDTVRVRQSVIAQKCGLKTTQTVSRITASLQAKGILEQRRCIYAANGTGTMAYKLCLSSGRYFRVSRHIIEERLTPVQLRMYLFICRAVSDKLGLCWNSYNDLAKLVGIKRSEAIEQIEQLISKNVIRKRLVRSRRNRRVYADNHYTLVKYGKHSPIRKECKKIGLPGRTDSPKAKCMINIHINKIDNITVSEKCQAAQHNFFAVRGSPPNRSSIILPSISFRNIIRIMI